MLVRFEPLTEILSLHYDSLYTSRINRERIGSPMRSVNE
jgi:hypothetical protein